MQSVKAKDAEPPMISTGDIRRLRGPGRFGAAILTHITCTRMMRRILQLGYLAAKFRTDELMRPADGQTSVTRK